MYYVPYGSDVSLAPLKRNETDGLEITDCKWTTPNNVDLYPDQVNFESDRYRIYIPTCNLTIYNIQEDTNGIYHCTINKKFISKAMLNYHGPPPKDFLDEYKWNLIAGFSTAGGILSLFIFVWAINKYRYKEEPRPKKATVYQVNTGYEMSTRDLTSTYILPSITNNIFNFNYIEVQINSYKQSDDAIDTVLDDKEETSTSDGVSVDSVVNQTHRF